MKESRVKAWRFKHKERIMEITSLTNAKVKQWAKYKEKKYREKERRFLIEGEHLIEEAVRANLVECIIVEREKPHPFQQFPVYEVTPEILRKLESSVSGTWIMAVCHMPQYSEADYGQRVIVLDDVQDPGNVGTIIRTALSFGYDAVLLSAHSCDIYNEKVIRSTQGALFHIPVIRGDVHAMLMELKQRGSRILATSLHNASALREVAVPEAFALVFGNEGKGVSEEVLRLADTHVFIEMHTFESLNVAVAAGICMYAFKK